MVSLVKNEGADPWQLCNAGDTLTDSCNLSAIDILNLPAALQQTVQPVSMSTVHHLMTISHAEYH